MGFGRTYYFKLFTDAPAIPTLTVHIHGVVMTAWVGFFIAQFYLIRSKRHNVHMNLGLLGIALAVLVLVVGFFTAAGLAKYGSDSMPEGFRPLSFFAAPFFDLVIFAVLFAGAIYFRKRPADHKRLMLLTAINFLPPAIARIPVESMLALGPLLYLGIPSLIALGLVGHDTFHNKKFNKIFLAGALLMTA